MGFLSVSYFQIFSLAFYGFYRKNFKKINAIFELARGRNLMVNNKDNRVLLSRNYWSDSCPWKFDVLKTCIFVLGTANFRKATISR